MNANNNYPGAMFLGDEVTDNVYDVANLFSKKFSTVYESNELSGTDISHYAEFFGWYMI